MKRRKMSLNKEVVANLSDTESDQLKGGGWDSRWCYVDSQNGNSCMVFCGGTQCAATCCCGPTYAECSNCHC